MANPLDIGDRNLHIQIVEPSESVSDDGWVDISDEELYKFDVCVIAGSYSHPTQLVVGRTSVTIPLLPITSIGKKLYWRDSPDGSNGSHSNHIGDYDSDATYVLNNQVSRVNEDDEYDTVFWKATDATKANANEPEDEDSGWEKITAIYRIEGSGFIDTITPVAVFPDILQTNTDNWDLTIKATISTQGFPKLRSV